MNFRLQKALYKTLRQFTYLNKSKRSFVEVPTIGVFGIHPCMELMFKSKVANFEVPYFLSNNKEAINKQQFRKRVCEILRNKWSLKLENNVANEIPK